MTFLNPSLWLLVLGLFYLRQSAAELSSLQIGAFNIQWDQEKPYLLVTSVSANPADEPKVLFRTLPNWPFLTVGFASSSSAPIESGNFKINEWVLYETPYQSIKSVAIHADKITFRGEIWGMVTQAHYTMTFSIDETAPTLLRFNVNTTAVVGSFNRVFLNYWCDSKELIYGLGVQYSLFNMKGRRVPIVVAEQGIGRGAEPLTSLLNYVGDGSGGYWHTTYAPKPLYITSHNRSMLLTNDEVAIFDFRDDDAIVIEVWGTSIHGYVIGGDSYADLLESITSVTGRMQTLPRWTQRGAILGLEGGTEDVSSKVRAIRDANVSVAGVWLQDWVGIRSAFDGDRLVWNWALNTDQYPGWDAMTADWRRSGIRTLSYINPFFSNPSGLVSNLSRNLFEEGVRNGYFVQSVHGGPYLLRSGSIESHMIDLTNPHARVWMKDVIKTTMLRETKVSGWMADFGEYLPFDAVLYDSSVDVAAYHNKYPEEWAALNEEAVSEYESEQSGDSVWRRTLKDISGRFRDTNEDREIVYFMRSAWLRSPGHSRSFWVGDQMVTWDAFDGIKTVLVAYLSGGIGGHSITHSDIGGYTVQEKGLFPCVRSAELLYRWTELEAFGSALFRTHIGSATEFNAQVYDKECSLSHFAVFSRVFKRLAGYRMMLMRLARDKGLPLVRPMFSNYAHDPLTWTLKEQYLFGDDFLIAPVLDPSTSASEESATVKSLSAMKCSEPYHVPVKVYIPAHSDWTHLWSGETVSGGETGKYVIVTAPIGNPPVFFLPTSVHGNDLRLYIQSQGLDVLFQGKNDTKRVIDLDEWRRADVPRWVSWLGVGEVR